MNGEQRHHVHHINSLVTLAPLLSYRCALRDTLAHNLRCSIPRQCTTLLPLLSVRVRTHYTTKLPARIFNYDAWRFRGRGGCGVAPTRARGISGRTIATAAAAARKPCMPACFAINMARGGVVKATSTYRMHVKRTLLHGRQLKRAARAYNKHTAHTHIC